MELPYYKVFLFGSHEEATLQGWPNIIKADTIKT